MHHHTGTRHGMAWGLRRYAVPQPTTRAGHSPWAHAAPSPPAPPGLTWSRCGPWSTPRPPCPPSQSGGWPPRSARPAWAAPAPGWRYRLRAQHIASHRITLRARGSRGPSQGLAIRMPTHGTMMRAACTCVWLADRPRRGAVAKDGLQNHLHEFNQACSRPAWHPRQVLRCCDEQVP